MKAIDKFKCPHMCLIAGRPKHDCKFFRFAGRGGYKCERKRGEGAATCMNCGLYEKEAGKS